MPAASPKTPHWPAIVATIADASLYLGLPKSLSIGPRWLLLAIIIFLLIPIIISHWHGHLRITSILTLIANGVITAFMITSIIFLIQGLPKHQQQPVDLLRSAAGLWLTNILVYQSFSVPALTKNTKDEFVKQYFLPYADKEIKRPNRFVPQPEFLQFHRDNIYLK